MEETMADQLMLNGLLMRWARTTPETAPVAAEYLASQLDWPVTEIRKALKASRRFRLVHVQGETEFFSLVADLPAACR